MTHEQHARAFLRFHRRRGGDVRDDWGAWLRLGPVDAAVAAEAWRVVAETLASEGVATVEAWEEAA